MLPDSGSARRFGYEWSSCLYFVHKVGRWRQRLISRPPCPANGSVDGRAEPSAATVLGWEPTRNHCGEGPFSFSMNVDDRIADPVGGLRAKGGRRREGRGCGTRQACES